MKEKESKSPKGLIIKIQKDIDGKKFFVEFFDALISAFPEHYAMTQGCIGKEYAQNSGIRVVLTEYDEITKKTQKVKALIPTYVFDRVRDVLSATQTFQINGAAVDNLFVSGDEIKSFLLSTQKETLSALRDVATNKSTAPIAFGKAVKAIHSNEATKLAPAALNFSPDYMYSQERVHPDEKTCDCDKLVLQRSGAEGLWNIYIENFDADLKSVNSLEYENERNIKKVKVELTDDEVYQIHHAVTNLFDMWKHINASKYIRQLGKE